ncbi:peptidoglycan D,D-transpeptidase FtsI family protein [Thalassobacillus hwangdonensis]|uniref:serine-type D-Ala-D-Ala carboxypeptidase n=1 Tax=Thalassobacillus hwangdonensis TaxID=546108 RepID=A0ABW3KYM2_9BACI
MGNKKDKKKKKSHLPFRLNILFFVIFLLFSTLILQLGVVQILNGEDFQEKIDRTVNTTVHTPVPRGKMYDRFGRVIVDNKPLYSITYTPPKGVQPHDRLELAQKLTQYIDMGDQKEIEAKVRLRDRKEYFYLLNEDEVRSRISDEESEKLDGGEEYQLMLDRIEEEEVDGYSIEELEVIAIKKELDQASELAPHVIKNEDISVEEFATVAENLNKLAGINVTSDWVRQYPLGGTFRNYIGSITSSKQGIPRSNLDYYLSLDYSRNDRVGESGLEKEYESYLRGIKEKVRYLTDKDQNVVETEVVREGSRGNDLLLSIDMELQAKVDEIVKKRLKEVIQKSPYNNRFAEDAMVAMMDPNTGEVLALSGWTYNRDRDKDEPEFYDRSYKVIQEQHLPGSTVKGASVLTALHEGVFQPGHTIYDRPLIVPGENGQPLKKGSYRQLGLVNDISALKYSSNVYMFLAAYRLGGDRYEPMGKLDFKADTYERLHYYFNQFGLGVKTGIDMPSESRGLVGTNPEDQGNMLDFMIGQYDTYTAMQLAQYVSTIANGGYRIRPHIVSEVRKPINEKGELGPLLEKNDTDVLNRIEMDESLIKRVQEGFRQVAQSSGGTAYTVFQGLVPEYDKPAEYSPAAKTGTAENTAYIRDDEGNIIDGVDTENHTLVGYAPHDNPEVAYSVIVPNLKKGYSYNVNKLIGRDILDAYFELKKERQEQGVDMDLTDEDKEDTEEDEESEQE